MYSTDDPPVPYLIENRVIVSGENLVDAQASFDQRTNEPVVSFRFDAKGAQRFGEATQQNVGKLFAIILDNQVISAPQIREPILGGTGQISGNFTAQSANDLAVLLRAGALPADLTIIEERTVGPSLGADSIAAGEMASVIAGILVLAFMVLAYGSLGIIANIALVANVVLIIAILSVLGATLTMPGIAGIVLTMGMAVDSNVIIYERVQRGTATGTIPRPVARFGLCTRACNGRGRQRDDLHRGSHPVLSRLRAGSWLRRHACHRHRHDGVHRLHADPLADRDLASAGSADRHPGRASSSLCRTTPTSPSCRCANMRSRCRPSCRSASAVMFMTKDMNYGIDFRGGSIIEIQAKGDAADAGDVRSRLSELNLGDVQVQEFGSDRNLLIRIEAQQARRQRRAVGGGKDQAGTWRAIMISAASRSLGRRFQANSHGPEPWAFWRLSWPC